MANFENKRALNYSSNSRVASLLSPELIAITLELFPSSKRFICK